MSPQHTRQFSRRRFLGGLTLAGTAGLLGWDPRRAAAEPPPETTTLRQAQGLSLCGAPQYVAGELLQAEGFLEVHAIKTNTVRDLEVALASGDVHLGMHFAAPLIVRLDQADPIVILAGVHPGCFELFGTERVRAIRDLKGKTVAINRVGLAQYVYVATMLPHIGLDPRKDVRFVEHSPAEGKRLLAEGKVDAYLGFPPDPQELRAKKIGQVVVNSAIDRPWSQYFCCMVVGNREFVRRPPVATKRALRAILKASDLCASEPERAARALVD